MLDWMQTLATQGLHLLMGPAQAGLWAATGWTRSAVSTGPWQTEAGPAGPATSIHESFQKASPWQFSALFTHSSHPRVAVKGTEPGTGGGRPGAWLAHPRFAPSWRGSILTGPPSPKKLHRLKPGLPSFLG